MQRKLLGSALLTILLVPVLLAFGRGGGWSVVTVEDLPDYLVVGEPVEITFSIRAHGQTLMSGLAPQLYVTTRDRAVAHTTQVEPKAPGRYSGQLTAPAAGTYTVGIATTYAGQTVNLLPLQAVARGEKPAPISAHERGRRLYVAKGCYICHTHAAVSEHVGVRAAPDLTEPRFAGEYLTRYLADPTIKPSELAFRMPDLGLKPQEIAALVAFLTKPADEPH